MADVSLFGRLKRLFSNDVVIRNIGGDELKVVDVNQIQNTGKYETNSLVDRFSRLYTQNSRNVYNPNLNYQTLRVSLYSDYEAMDTDPIIASALDIIADEATIKNDQNEVVSIKSSDENIQKVLYNLFYDVLNSRAWRIGRDNFEHFIFAFIVTYIIIFMRKQYKKS